MLTRRRCFQGETISDTLASVLKEQPDWARLPEDTPPAIHRLLRRCLAKDPRQRLSDAADARLELSEALEPPHPKEHLGAGGRRRSSPDGIRRPASVVRGHPGRRRGGGKSG